MYNIYSFENGQDVIEMRIRECGSKFILTDYDRANRVVEIVKKLDFICEIFVIGDVPVQGCTLFDLLLQDPGDGITIL